MRAMSHRAAAVLTAGAVLAAALGGCSLQTTGALKGNLHLQARFGDVQQLVPGEAVEIDDVPVGSVTSIHLDGYQAVVTMSVQTGRKVPVGTVAVLSQATLLGEQYVDLELPARFDHHRGPWVGSGTTLPSGSTAGIEEFVSRAGDVLGALTAGNVASTVQALATGLTGRGPELNQLIAELAQVARAVAGQASDLGTVIDGLGSLGRSLAPASTQLGALIDDLTSSTGVLAANRQRLLSTLTQLTRLAGDLNAEVLVPHLAQVEGLIAELGPILGSAVQKQSQIGDLITGLRRFVDVFPHAAYQGQLLIFFFLAGAVLGTGTTVRTSAAPSLTDLLRPPS
jgi:phospholipid/cholesterol/gamma-HCH transport system substrate-binding protein